MSEMVDKHRANKRRMMGWSVFLELQSKQTQQLARTQEDATPAVSKISTNSPLEVTNHQTITKPPGTKPNNRLKLKGPARIN